MKGIAMDQSVIDKLEETAISQQPIPAGLGFPESFLLSGFILLYGNARRGHVTQEQGREFKAALLEAYRALKKKLEAPDYFVGLMDRIENAYEAVKAEPGNVEAVRRLLGAIEKG